MLPTAAEQRVPTLTDLPPPPPGRTGWPWTKETPPARTPPSAGPWPRISIITPVLNHADTIEETIRSVLLQGYPNLEYIIMDGGSTDGTRDVIERYRPWLACAVSEPDGGRSDAINKGLRRATGQVLAYINADDAYTPGALQAVGAAFAVPAVQWLSGPGRLVGPDAGWGCTWPEKPWREPWQWAAGSRLCQPSTFWRRDVTEAIGEFDTGLQVSMDQDYWLRMATAGCRLTWTRRVLSRFRTHEEGGAGRAEGDPAREHILLWRRYAAQLSRGERHKAGRLMAELHGRRLRWRAWRQAWQGNARPAVKDCLAAVSAHPMLLLSAKTWAVPPLAVVRGLTRLVRRRRE
jgi:glycosyltransferase involved in cell wall biosynthesis